MAKAARVVLYKDAAKEWRWKRIDGGNNRETAASSESYRRRLDAWDNAVDINGGEVIYDVEE